MMTQADNIRASTFRVNNVFIDSGKRLIAQIWQDDETNVIDIFVTQDEIRPLLNEDASIYIGNGSGATTIGFGPLGDILERYKTAESIIVYKWDHDITLKDNIMDRLGLLIRRLKFWK